MLGRSLLLTGLLALAACNAGDRPANNAAVTNIAVRPIAPANTANEVQPAQVKLDQLDLEPGPQPAAAPDPRLVTRAWFAGRWTDTGDCAEAGEFAASGMYQLADGTRGMWNIVDGRLVVQHAGGRGSVALRKIAEDAVEVVNEDGSVGRSQRC